MIFYTPSNWYWIVAGDEARVWSSRAAEYVAVDNEAFIAWQASGNQPTVIATETDLWDVLKQQHPAGLPADFLHDLKPYQFQAILDLAGLMVVAEAAIAAMSPAQAAVARARMQYSQVYSRDDTLFSQLVTAAGLDPDAVDQYWRTASRL